MHQFASGWKKSYYGKGDVTVYRLNRESGHGAVFGASVLILIYGDAFWPTYTEGDNTSLVATDSMKNFIQRETMNFTGNDLESYCQFIADKFMAYLSADPGRTGNGRLRFHTNATDSTVAFSPRVLNAPGQAR